MDIETLRQRAAIIKQIRAFFDSKGYLEIDTPLLSDNLIPESCLEVFETKRIFPAGSKEKSKPMWLIPSPEINMKKFIAQHKVNVYQICKCFRNGESEGHLHNHEFTMLEYYTMDADYLDSLTLTEELLAFMGSGKRRVGSRKGRGTRDEGHEHYTKTNLDISNISDEQILLSPVPCPLSPIIKITVAEAFERYAGFDLFKAAQDQNILEEEARRLGLEPAPGLPVPVLYDLIFIHAVEPNLKNDFSSIKTAEKYAISDIKTSLISGKPIALLDYPAFVPCLAKKSKDGLTFERWELYLNGVELANCFSEETDPEAVKEFFINEQTEKEKTALVAHNVDTNYHEIFRDFPKCSGVAMGLDRLIMALLGKSNINCIMP